MRKNNILRPSSANICSLHPASYSPPLDWVDSLTCLSWDLLICGGRQFPCNHSRYCWPRRDSLRLLKDLKMNPFLWNLLYCVLLLFSDALATYHLRAGNPHLITAQSYAQTRHNSQPILRTLNPTSKFMKISVLQKMFLGGRGFVIHLKLCFHFKLLLKPLQTKFFFLPFI